jgi:predicted methyltransferase
MKPISLLETAHAEIRRCLQVGDSAIDATLGNGHDTLFLASCVGAQGRIFGFDVQAQAIANTRQRLQTGGVAQQVILFHASHADMLEIMVAQEHALIKAVMFNLGYLPGGDKSLVTHIDTTLRALRAGMDLLAKTGVMTVLAYPGHPGGDVETGGISDWCRSLVAQQQAVVEVIESRCQQVKAPRLFVIRKQVC